MTTSISSTLGTAIYVSTRVCFLWLSSVVWLLYKYFRVNALCTSLIRIFTPSQTHNSVRSNVSGIFVLIQVYGQDHMLLVCCMVLWIIITKVDFSWVPIDTEKFSWNSVLTTIEPHVHGFLAPLLNDIIWDPCCFVFIGCYWSWFVFGPSHIFQLCSYILRIFYVNK